MAFVKLDVGILRSSLWLDRPARELFITALLMCEPWVTNEEIPALEPDEIRSNGFSVPPGAYGFIACSPLGIIHQAGMDMIEGRNALRRLCNPDQDSRSPEFDGRRLARISGGVVVLNYAKHRNHDHTSTERSRRWRERLREQRAGTHRDARGRVVTPLGTHADAEADSRSRKEREDASASPPPAKPARERGKNGTRIPPDWHPDLSGLTIPQDMDPDGEGAKFRDYWQARAGKEGVKLDWQATWRNWVRRSVEEGRYTKRAQHRWQ